MPTEIFDPTRKSTKSEFKPGTVLWDDGGKAFIYLQANGAVTIGRSVTVGLTGQGTLLDVSAIATLNGAALGVAQQAFADNEYGWFQVFGTATSIDVRETVTNGDICYVGATDGELGTTAVAGGNVFGVYFTARTGAGITDGFLTFPRVQNNPS